MYKYDILSAYIFGLSLGVLLMLNGTSAWQGIAIVLGSLCVGIYSGYRSSMSR